jgi:hypothetical protein
MIAVIVALGLLGQDPAPSPFRPPLDYVEAIGWTAIGADPERAAAVLAQPARQTGRLWTRHEHRELQANGSRSSSELLEVDCSEWRFRVLQVTIFSEPNMRGSTTVLNYQGGWTFAAPGSIAETIMDFGCGD